MDEERRQRFAKLYEEFAAHVQAYAVRRGQRELAPDIVSDVFVVAWRKFDAIPASPLPWLLGVARKVMANQLRGARRRQALFARLVLNEAETGPPVADAGVLGSVLHALASLPERDRETLMLIAWEGLDPREAAAVLGCSSTAFRVRLHRARAKFKRALDATELGRQPAPPSSDTVLPVNHSIGDV